MGCCKSRGRQEVSEVYISNQTETVDEFIKEALNSHNALRKKHGASELVLSQNLSMHAQAHAEFLSKHKMYLHSNCIEGGKKLGQNIAISTKYPLSGKSASDVWYDEVKVHNFGNPTHQVGSENFTQLIWKNTKEVGFGISQGTLGDFYAVANYYPVGNVKGEFNKNVQK